MWVKAESDTLQEIKLHGMEKPATFSENNLAQVTESDGQILVETINTITIHE